MKKLKRIIPILFAVLALFLSSCALSMDETDYDESESTASFSVIDDVSSDTTTKTSSSSEKEEASSQAEESSKAEESSEDASSQAEESSSETEEAKVPDEDGYYYDVESVVLYLDTYGKLPPNYIKKNDARDLGWSGGSVQRYKEGAAIGGDRFGNNEGLLPTTKGVKYTECDIDTDGAKERGAKRLIFSNDGRYFYTDDHYESFTELYVENGEVKQK